MKRLAVVGFVVALLLVGTEGSAGASAHRPPLKQHIKPGWNFTVHLNDQQGPLLCFQEHILSPTQFTTSSFNFAPESMQYGFLTDGTPYLNESFMIPRFALSYSISATWDRTTRSFHGYWGNFGIELPATIARYVRGQVDGC